jgi:hypothetical protein
MINFDIYFLGQLFENTFKLSLYVHRFTGKTYIMEAIILTKAVDFDLKKWSSPEESNIQPVFYQSGLHWAFLYIIRP